jgi:endogenous inhibitor of DNA gyrase (YacG/DUF329 family)
MRYSHGMSKPNPSQKCPSCERNFEADIRGEFMPFCSMRCKFADLHRWMSESIGLPIGSSEAEDDEEPDPPASNREWKFD